MAMPFVARAIRVAVANQPRLMRELIAMSFEGEQDIEVVANIREEAEILGSVETCVPDFLIVSLNSRHFGASVRDDILQRHPEMQIMGLAEDGNSLTLFSASDGIRSKTFRGPKAEILGVMRSNSRIRNGV